MNLLKLKYLPGQGSMLLFHALARMGFQGLIIVSPKDPLASVGYFEDAREAIDFEHCRRANIPVMRREVGGGATYLDKNQVFYQIIYDPKRAKFPREIERVFEIFSGPACRTYQRFGIDAGFRGANDIVTSGGRKIAGEGGGDIAGMNVFVGGILMDFDHRAAGRILRIPDEKFRGKLFRSMEENVTSMRRELGSVPEREDIVKTLAEEFEKVLGPLEEVEFTAEMKSKMRELEARMNSIDFLFRKSPRKEGIKIREGVKLFHGRHKAPGGLIRSSQLVESGRIRSASLSGDFQLFPRGGLERIEKGFAGVERRESPLREAAGESIERNKLQIPGVKPGDFAKSLLDGGK